MDVPDCSTDGVQSSTRKEARQATNVTCGLSPTVTSAVVRRLIKEELILELQRRGIPPAEGTSNQDMIIQLRREIDGQGTMAASTLSREVSLAVLLRLDPEDLRYELLRRNITPAGDSTKESLIAQLGDEMVKEYFNQQASSTSLRNNTGNTPMQEEPTGTEETSEARPTEETPVAEEGAAAAEEEETDDKEPTEAQGRSYVGVKETRDDGQMQKPPDISLDTNPSPSVTVMRKQTEDPNTGPSTQRTNTSEETDIIDLTSDLITPTGQSAHDQERLIAQLFSDEMGPGKEYFSRQASSVNLGNNTRNTPTQEVPTGAEETSQAAPVQETPSGAMATAGPSSDVAMKRKQTKDTNIEPSTPAKRLNIGEQPTMRKQVKEEPHLDYGSTSRSGGAGPGSSASSGMSNAVMSGAHGRNRFLCPYKDCGYNARSPSDLNQHKRKHTGEKPFVCLCGFASAWKPSLKNHKTKCPHAILGIWNSRLLK